MKAIMSWCFVAVLAFSLSALAQERSNTLRLPKPDTVGGKPLMQTLSERKTSRSFSDKKLPDQILSNLLWAAFGINRPDGHRTAPSAMNWQEIDMYVATADGVFLYEPKTHALKSVLTGDFRAKTGGQDFVAAAPVNIVYIADLKKVGSANPEDVSLYSGADCGFIAQNVYLFCASEGLATVVRANIDRPTLGKKMKLGTDQRITLSQTVGYPKK